MLNYCNKVISEIKVCHKRPRRALWLVPTRLT